MKRLIRPLKNKATNIIEDLITGAEPISELSYEEFLECKALNTTVGATVLIIQFYIRDQMRQKYKVLLCQMNLVQKTSAELSIKYLTRTDRIQAQLERGMEDNKIAKLENGTYTRSSGLDREDLN